jgi:hypothetical protein
MSLHSDILDLRSSIVVPTFVCAAGGGTDAMLYKPATFAVDVAGTGYTNGAATMVLADGNTIGVTLTTNAGAISTSASDTGVVAVVQAGGSLGTAHVATYATAATSSPCFIDFGALWGLDDTLPSHWPQFVVSGKTVTEHDTAPGGSKTLTVNLYWSDEVLVLTGVATILADRKAASSAKAITNAIDTTQHWGFLAAFTPPARYCYVTFTWSALDAGASFTTQLRLNRV